VTTKHRSVDVGLVYLTTPSDTCHHWLVTGRNSRIYSTSTVATKFARFESSWLQRVARIGREGLQNTHHWSIELKQRLRTESAKLDHVVIAAAICQWRRW